MTPTLEPRASALGTAGHPAGHPAGVGDATRARPEVDPTERELAPVVRRESLTWSGGHGGRPLVVELDAENPHDRTTPGLLARLAIAPFGAFLPHRTVDAFGIPALLPGARVHLVRPLAPFLLPESSPTDSVLRGMAAMQSREAAWAGNLEVWIGQRPAVERHCADLDCLQAGRRNQAMAFVACERDDAVSYACSGAGDDWTVELIHHAAASLHAAAAPVREGQWYSAWPRGLLEIDIRPPPDAGAEGGVVVNVTRRSDGRTLPVEFRLRTARA